MSLSTRGGNSMDIRMEFIPRDALGRFQKIGENLLALTREAMVKTTDALRTQVRINIAGSFRNPNRMMSAVGSNVTQRGTQWIGEVDASGQFTGTRLPYMRIQEYGGIVHLPDIFPKRKQALYFTGASYPFAKAEAHDVTIRGRSYLRAALIQRQQEIQNLFKAAVQQATDQR